jgi:dCTP deaminase
MILSGPAIQRACEIGDILIDPFVPEQINPNSYNFRLSAQMVRVSSIAGDFSYQRFEIPPNGVVLRPKELYLGSTVEIIGSKKHAMTLLGRSSLGRLGIFLNKTADLGHVGAVGRWTLEISVVQPTRVYADMLFGQVAFWVSAGSAVPYQGRYQHDLGPRPNRDTSLLGGCEA